jgi:hypothetical protein
MEEELLIEPIIYYNFDYHIEIDIETFFIDNQYTVPPLISEKDSYLLSNKMYGEFVKNHTIQQEDFTIPESCPVCMCSEQEIERKFYFKTQCGHVFCAGCIAGVVTNKSMTCPLCRTDMVFQDFKYIGDANSDPEPPPQPSMSEVEDFYNFDDEDEEVQISGENFDQTLYEIFLEYWRTIN